MRCPRCQTEMKRNNRDGLETDECPSCNGLWLDDGELVKILRNGCYDVSESEKRQAEQAGKPGVNKVERDSVELCPHCQGRMNPVNYDYASGIVVDTCPKGHGVWLDGGELQRIQAHRLAAEDKAARLGPDLVRKLFGR
jgi:Zn-finger nucleic acid-binding protein